MLLFCHEWLDPDRNSDDDELPMADSDDDDTERRRDDTNSFTSNANAGWNCGSSTFTVPRPRLLLLPPLSERCWPTGVRSLLLWNDAFRSTFGLVPRCLDMDMDVDVDGPHVDANDGWPDDKDAVEPVGDPVGIS